MVGLHMMHRMPASVFPLPRQPGSAPADVRSANIFSRPERLRTTIRDLVAAGELPQSLATMPEPLGFYSIKVVSTIPDATYRFVRHEPGVDVVLFGTGNSEHLRTNIASILKPPLPDPDRQQLAAYSAIW